MQASAEKIWSSAQEHLRSKLSADTYNMWFASLRASAIDSSHVTLEAANEFCEVWLKDNYMSLLQDAWRSPPAGSCRSNSKSGDRDDSGLGRADAAPRKAKAESPSSRSSRPPTARSHFNPKNTFDTFVVGNNNNFAYAAALAVAQAPGKSYNPLFLYGGVGLGKTHLLHAIGQHVAGNKKGARVAYRFVGEIHQRIH